MKIIDYGINENSDKTARRVRFSSKLTVDMLANELVQALNSTNNQPIARAENTKKLEVYDGAHISPPQGQTYYTIYVSDSRFAILGSLEKPNDVYTIHKYPGSPMSVDDFLNNLEQSNR